MITRPRRGTPAAARGPAVRGPAVLGAALLAAGVLAGCGSTAAGHTAPAAPDVHLSLATSAGYPGGNWAVLVMGGSAAEHNNFWQVFVRPGRAAGWKLATPLGVASNGGIAVAAEGGPALAAAIRPSQDLSFSPLASSSDNGAKWTQSGLLDARLAASPDALAAAPGGGLIALTRTGDVELRAHPGAAWTRLASEHAVVAAGGRGCRPAQLTSVAYSPSGVPLVAGACARAGQAGIFRLAGGRWSAVGPALPAALARQDVEVLQMASAGRAVAALLVAGTRLRHPPPRGVVEPGRYVVDPVPAVPARRGAPAVGRVRRRLAGRGAVRRPGGVGQRARGRLADAARAARRRVVGPGWRGHPGRRPGWRLPGPERPRRPAVRLGPVVRRLVVEPVPGHQRAHSLRLVRMR